MPKALESVQHDVQVEENILAQYEKSQDFQSFIKSHVEPLNDLEVDFQDFITQLPLANAIGNNLNYWGEILQAPSRPVADSVFRTSLYALIAAYNSLGTAAAVNAILDLIVQAEETTILDFGEGRFGFYIGNPSTDFDLNFFFIAVDLAKALGTELVGVTISSSALSPIFSFDTDTRDNSIGGFYSLARIDTIDFYTTYDFADEGTLSTTDRIIPTESAGAENTTIRLQFFVATAIATDFQNELDSVIGTEGGQLIVYDRAGTRWTFIAGPGGIPTTVDSPQPDWRAINVEVIFDGSDTCLTFQDGQRVKNDSILFGDEDVNDGDPFQSYDETQEADYDTQNPNGLGKEESLVSDEQGGYYSQFFDERSIELQQVSF